MFAASMRFKVSRILILLLLVSGLSQAQTASDVLRWIREATAGDARAAFWLGYAYESGKGVPQDLGKAMTWFVRSAGKSNADAQNALGRMFEDGEGVETDYAQAAYWYQLACESRPDYGGAGQGCANLGLLYLSGHGVPQDNVEAYKYFRIARAGVDLDEVTRKMTEAEITDAENRVEQWRLAHPETK
jgi:uncharacterized protein